MYQLKQRQIELDHRLSALESLQQSMFQWLGEKKQQLARSLYEPLGSWGKLRCWWLGKRGWSLVDQVASVTGIDLQNDDRFKTELASHFNLDTNRFYDDISNIKGELHSLFWDAIFTTELRNRAETEQARKRRISEVLAARESRHKEELNRQLQMRRDESRRESLESKYKRSDMLVRERDYKRGNLVDNYFRNHLRERIAAAFGFSCVGCSSPESLVLDHWAIPKNEGGNFVLCRSDTRQLYLNVVVLCQSCNSSKGELKPVQWIGVDRAEQVDETLTQLMAELWATSEFRRVSMKWYELDLLDCFLLDQINGQVE
ncbi:MAG: hypothetical protein U0939_22660 [Pirellulales bacterium]